MIHDAIVEEFSEEDAFALLLEPLFAHASGTLVCLSMQTPWRELIFVIFFNTLEDMDLTADWKCAIIIPQRGMLFRMTEAKQSGRSNLEKHEIVQSVERAFRILDLLRANSKGMGVIEIAKSLDLSTTTTHRLLQTLMNLRAVQQEPGNRHYSLAPQMLLYGKAVLDRFDFIRSAHPLLGEISKTVGETVFMGILDNYDLVYVDHVDSLDHVLRMTPQIGRRQPSHCTALGKVLLANLPEERLEAFLNRKSLPRMTENTITDPQDLRRELDAVRRKGYALDREETEVGICCVAAPIRRPDGRVVAALSVSGPATRLRKKGLKTFLREKVQETASRISQLIVS